METGVPLLPVAGWDVGALLHIQTVALRIRFNFKTDENITMADQTGYLALTKEQALALAEVLQTQALRL